MLCYGMVVGWFSVLCYGMEGMLKWKEAGGGGGEGEGVLGKQEPHSGCWEI